MLNRFILQILAFAVFVGLVAPHGHRAARSQTETATEPPDAGKGIKLYRESDGHFYADAEVNGTTVHFLVDTGASMVALRESDARKAGFSADSNQFGVIGSGASGAVMGRSVMFSSIKLGPKRADDVKGAIVGDDLRVSLLGQSFLSRIGSVNIADDEMTLR